MPLITCNECGASASTSAKTCPGCGASAKVMRRSQGPWPTTKRGWLVLGILGLFATSALLQLGIGSPAPRTKTPEDIASDKRNRAAYNAVSAVKKSLRDPETATFEQVWVDEEAKTVCIAYRARNGFGGLGVGRITFTQGIPSERTSNWNRQCANQTMYDLKGIARIVD